VVSPVSVVALAAFVELDSSGSDGRLEAFGDDFLLFIGSLSFCETPTRGF